MAPATSRSWVIKRSSLEGGYRPPKALVDFVLYLERDGVVERRQKNVPVWFATEAGRDEIKAKD